MPLARTLFVSLLLAASLAPTASAQALFLLKHERATGGTLDLAWDPGFGVGRTFQPLLLPTGDPAIPNPSGDNSVAVLTNNATGLGGIALAATSVLEHADYTWSGWFFTGAGDTRRGLVVRAKPTNGFQTFYQLVVNPGLFQLRFRKFVDGAPVPDLQSWFLNTLPGGVPQVNTWHHMKVVALGNTFRCFFDGIEMTTAPIVDATDPILQGWVGAYNFSAAVGEVPVYFDDLKLEADTPSPAVRASWGAVKQRFR